MAAAVRNAGGVLARTPHPSPAALATALSHAFLAAPEWTRDSLVAAGSRILGARRCWLGPLARSVLAAHHRRPADAPRELAAHIAASNPFTEALARARAQRKPIRLAAYALPGPGLREGSRQPAGIAGLGELAEFLGLTQGELDWFADTGHWNRLARPGRLHHYRHEWRERPGRTPRLLEIPGLRLRAVQRQVLDGLLAPIPLHGAAHGFVPGRSAAGGAALHTGASLVISLDLASFFATVTAGKVYGALRQADHPEAVAHTLTGLCTHAVPPRIITAMPPGGTSAERFALRRRCASPTCRRVRPRLRLWETLRCAGSTPGCRAGRTRSAPATPAMPTTSASAGTRPWPGGRTALSGVWNGSLRRRAMP